MRSTLRMLCRAMNIVTLAVLPLSTTLGASSAEERESPPAPAPPRAVNFPKPVEKTLSNGLRVVVIERELPLCSVQVLVKNGAEVDPPGKAGLAKLTAALLTEGTTTRSAPQIAEAVDALGATLGSDARWDASTVDLNVLAAKFDPAMEILADVVRHPAFQADEVERLRKQSLDELSIDLTEPRVVARYAYARVLYGEGPYGHSVAGTPASLQKIGRDDLVRLHAACYRPDNAVLVVGGGVRAEAVFQTAERLFGDWKKPSEPLPAVAAQSGEAAKRRIVVVDMAEAGQAAVYVARPGLRRTDPDRFGALVANAVLGGGYSSRLNQEVRIKRGLSYGANSVLDLRREAGPFLAVTQTKNESAAVVASLLLEQIGRLATEPVPETELVPRKATLSGNFARGLETLDGLVAEVSRLALYGLGFDEINAYIGNVGKVQAAEIQKLVASRLDAAGASIIVVGTADKFVGELRKQFPEAEVIPEAELDLDSATLRKPPAKSGP